MRSATRGLFGHAGRVCVIALAAPISCVAYDTAGPAVPSIGGTYTVSVEFDYTNYLELHVDTVVASITLRNTYYRGSFAGFYRIADDSGGFAGALKPDSSFFVTVFGSPPTPIAYVATVRRLFPWCDFARLDAGPMKGRLTGASLIVDGGGLMPCYYRLFGQFQPIQTGLFVHIRRTSNAP